MGEITAERSLSISGSCVHRLCDSARQMRLGAMLSPQRRGGLCGVIRAGFSGLFGPAIDTTCALGTAIKAAGREQVRASTLGFLSATPVRGRRVVGEVHLGDRTDGTMAERFLRGRKCEWKLKRLEGEILRFARSQAGPGEPLHRRFRHCSGLRKRLLSRPQG